MKQCMLFVSMLCLSCMLSAQTKVSNQHQGNERKQLEQGKVAFINKYVGFTDEESRLFWKNYQDYRRQLHLSRNVVKQTLGLEKRSEKEYQDALDILQAERVRQAQYDRDFYKQLTTFLSAEKIYKYFDAENMYKRQLVRRIENESDKK